jgi:hypothetical protein
MNNRDTIIKYIHAKSLATPHEIMEYVGINGSMVHRYLKKLVEEGVLEKKGQAPKVYYGIAQDSNVIKEKIGTDSISSDYQEIIEQNFTLLKPDGKEITGLNGFVEWCSTRKYTIKDKATEYVDLLKKYEHFKKNSVIDATEKLTTTFTSKTKFLDHLYYLHPYSLPVFGKTKIATWLFHAKQTQNKLLMRRVFDVIIPEIQTFIKKEKPDAIAFVPPTVPRSIQIMKEMQKHIASNLPIIKIEKIKTPIMIQQKSLKDISDRIHNAENTMIVKDTGNVYKKVLVIDDFTGSGSTLNVIAGKIKEKNVSKKVIGLTITGSMNGFDVIKEI